MTPQILPVTDRIFKELQKQDAVSFDDGIPGFPNEKKFVLLQNPEERPFIWMQSVTNPKLCFIVTSPFTLFPEYLPDVPDDELAGIGSPNSTELMLLTIVKFVNSKSPEVHTNLKAPVIINLKKLQGRQVILNNESIYSERAVYRMKAAESNAA
jgi:flagellar assembly factor FliW